MVKIIYEKELCISCGSCQLLCPKFWKMDDGEKAELLGSEVNSETGNFELEIEEIECNNEAADSCPVQCIHVETAIKP